MGILTLKNGRKTCRKCGVNKEESGFGYTKDARYQKKYIDAWCKECRKQETYAWRAKNPTRNKAIGLRSRDKLKELVYAHYGVNGKAVCVECGFSDIRGLCIDHVNNNGAEERRSIRDKHFAGSVFHRWLRDKSFPEGYQTLCANCNLIKEVTRRRNGIINTI